MNQTDKTCRCRRCDPPPDIGGWMVLCSICGNKRCNHAADHEYPCTGSNEPDVNKAARLQWETTDE